MTIIIFLEWGVIKLRAMKDITRGVWVRGVSLYTSWLATRSIHGFSLRRQDAILLGKPIMHPESTWNPQLEEPHGNSLDYLTSSG